MRLSVCKFAIALASVATLCVSLNAQERQRDLPRNSRDTIFNSIELTREGVTAVDTLGNHWVYDFDNNSFVPDKETQSTTRPSERDRRSEVSALPASDRCTVPKTVKPFQKTVLVGYDEYVGGAIVAYGRVIVKGWVKGDVQSINGRVLITESGQVDGDVKAPEIVVNEGGKIMGEQSITGPLGFTGDVLSAPFTADGVYIVTGFIIFLLVSVFLVLSLFPRYQQRVEHCMTVCKVKTYFVGLGMIFLIWLPLFVLAVSIVGLILIPFIPLAYLAAIVLGCVSFGRLLGGWLLRRMGRMNTGVWIESYLGVLALMTLWMIVAVLLGSNLEGSAGYGFGIFFMVVSILISTFPVLSGLGAVLLTRFGYRDYSPSTDRKKGRGTSEAPAPAPPPIPQMPGVLSTQVLPLMPLGEGDLLERTTPPNRDSQSQPPLPSGGK